jgi:hypothetical protein
MSFIPPNRTTYKEIVDLLIPFFNSTNDRKSLLHVALYGSPVLNQINYEGSAQPFTVNLITTLLNFGSTDGRHTILHLLDAAQNQVGADKQQQIAELKQKLGDDTSSLTSPATPSQGSPTGTTQNFNIGSITAENVNIGGTQNITVYGNEPTVPDAPTSTPSSNDSAVKRDQVFISYSHKETAWMDDLMKSLQLRMRYGSISVWNDKHIKPGDKWRDEINNALAAARVAVLMVSRDFLASSFIMDKELPVILDAAKEQDLTIIWIPVTYSGVRHTPINEYQAAGSPLLSPSKTLDSLSEAEKNRAIEQVADEIMDAYNAFDA